MQFNYFSDYRKMSEAAVHGFDKVVTAIKDPVACLATGSSPLGMYRNLVASGNDYRQLTVVKLDEWLGLTMDHPSTCEKYLQQEIIEPLKIPAEKYLGFRSDPKDPEAECVRVQGELNQLRGIDICVLGLGKNGHIGLNEPARLLKPNCHLSRLSQSSRGHAMLEGEDAVVSEGLTLGMADIMGSGQILLLVAGKGKERVFETLRSAQITNLLPASLLWEHPNVRVLVDCGSTGIPRSVE